MPRRCSVYGCRSNYDGEVPVSTYSLPSDESLRSKWIEAIPTDLSKLKQPIICIKHFCEEDIIRFDTVPYKGVLKSYPRVIPKLKEGALPCIFPNTPYYNTFKYSSENFEAAIESNFDGNDNYLMKDCIKCLEDIYNNFKSKVTASDRWTVLQCQNKLLVCLIILTDDIPKIMSNVTISEKLEFSVFLDKTPKIVNSITCFENLEFSVISDKIKISKFPFYKSKVQKMVSWIKLGKILRFIELLIDE